MSKAHSSSSIDAGERSQPTGFRVGAGTGVGDDAPNLSRTFKYLLATQFLARGVPFIFNSWIVRHLTEEDYAH